VPEYQQWAARRNANAPFPETVKSAVRRIDNCNWTFIGLITFASYVYANEFQKRNFRGITAGLTLYAFYETR
jgi:hypothetical protein